MSNQPLLQFISGGTPLLNTDHAILGAPVRHVFMIGTVWYWASQNNQKNIQILEIGSWVGASALSWAQGINLYCHGKGTLTCLDAWQPFFDRTIHTDDVYRTMEEALVSDAAYQLFQHNIKTLDPSITCQHLRGKSEHLLPLLREQCFDIIFIDANHAYEAVLRDIQLAMPLLKNQGILCGDDLNKQLSAVDYAHAKQHAHQDFIKDPVSGRGYHPGVTLAVGETFGDVSAWGGFWAMQKNKNTWQKLSLKGMPVVYPNHFPKQAIERARENLMEVEVI